MLLMLITLPPCHSDAIVRARSFLGRRFTGGVGDNMTENGGRVPTRPGLALIASALQQTTCSVYAVQVAPCMLDVISLLHRRSTASCRVGQAQYNPYTVLR